MALVRQPKTAVFRPLQYIRRYNIFVQYIRRPALKILKCFLYVILATKFKILLTVHGSAHETIFLIGQLYGSSIACVFAILLVDMAEFK